MAMVGMEPAFSYMIPSIEDSLPLDCRIYLPEALLTSLLHAKWDVPAVRASIVAHPYAPLGGCYDDPVVLALTHALVKQGYIVVTFNFRGAADSKGRTSWSGHGEKQDYISVIGFLLSYIRALSSQRASPENGAQLELLLSGYSYGSLILSKLPGVTNIADRFDTAIVGSCAAEIILKARRIASKTTHATGGPEAHNSQRAGADSFAEPHSLASRDPPEHAQRDVIKLRYLLISPLLPPLSHILVPSLQIPRFLGPSDTQDSSSGLGSNQYPTLAVYGTHDGFTSAKKLALWVEKLQAAAPDAVQGVAVEGAGHFWREPGVMKQLQDGVRNWLGSI